MSRRHTSGGDMDDDDMYDFFKSEGFDEAECRSLVQEMRDEMNMHGLSSSSSSSRHHPQPREYATSSSSFGRPPQPRKYATSSSSFARPPQPREYSTSSSFGRPPQPREYATSSSSFRHPTQPHGYSSSSSRRAPEYHQSSRNSAPVFNEEAYQYLRSRGFDDATVRHAMRDRAREGHFDPSESSSRRPPPQTREPSYGGEDHFRGSFPFSSGMGGSGSSLGGSRPHGQRQTRRDGYRDASYHGYTNREFSDFADDPFDFDFFDMPNTSSHHGPRTGTRNHGYQSSGHHRSAHNPYGQSSENSQRQRHSRPHEQSSYGDDNSNRRSHAEEPSDQYDGGIKPDVDLYTVMAVSKTATDDELKRAHRKLSLENHPDRVPASMKDKATERMAEINRAYDVLKDKKLRKAYDRTGKIFPSE